MKADDEFINAVRAKLDTCKAAFASTGEQIETLNAEWARLATLRDLLTQTLEALDPAPEAQPTVAAKPPSSPGRTPGLSVAAVIERDAMRSAGEARVSFADAMAWGHRNGAPESTGDHLADLRAVNKLRKQEKLPPFTVTLPKG